MIEALQREIARHGEKVAVVPVYHLQEIRQDIEDLKSREDLNDFQQYIVNDLYMLDILECDFEIRSIIITATPARQRSN